MKKSMNVILAIVLIVVAAGGAFYGGMRYQKSKTPTRPAGLAGFNFGGAGGTNGTGGRFFRTGGGTAGGVVRGTISAVNGTSVTVQETNGSSKIVILGTNVAISKSESASTSDVATGQTVMVVGTTNSDGSITATDIQLNPTTGAGFGGGAAAPSSTSDGATTQ